MSEYKNNQKYYTIAKVIIVILLIPILIYLAYIAFSSLNDLNTNKPDDVKDASLGYGLTNPGNNCYVNSVVIFLYSTEIIRKSVLEYTGDSEVIKCLKELFVGLDNNQRGLSATNLLKSTSNEFKDYGSQNDANEYIKILFRNIYKENLITEKEHCEFDNKIECMSCHIQRKAHTVKQETDILELILNVSTEKKTISLEEYVALWFKPAPPTNEKENGSLCESEECEGVEKHVLNIQNLNGIPEYFYAYLTSSYVGAKSKLKINMTHTILFKGEVYEVVSVIEYRGKGIFGHYVAYVPHGEKWKLLNDSRVSIVSSEKVVPYLVMFKRKREEETPVGSN